MNRREQIVKEEYKEGGWTAVHKGWPDFLMIRGTPITDEKDVFRTIEEARLVEVKREKASLRPSQKTVKKVLQDHFGIDYCVERVDKHSNISPNFSNGVSLSFNSKDYRKGYREGYRKGVKETLREKDV